MEAIAERYVRELASEVESRVGKVGRRVVTLSQLGSRLESITLSRGGVVVSNQSEEVNYEARRREHVFVAGDNEGQLQYPNAPEPTTPIYEPSLAVVGYHVGVEGEEGLYNYDSVELDDKLSRRYVLRQADNGLWQAFDAWRQSKSGNEASIDTYFLDAARPVTAHEEGLAIQGLITSFDQGLITHSQQAIENESGLVTQLTY